LLPWPPDARSLRGLSFPSVSSLPWSLLALVNVRHVVRVNDAFYRNVATGGRDEAAPEHVEIVDNPVRAVPRHFFTEAVATAESPSQAVRWLGMGTLRDDPAAAVGVQSIVEGYSGPTRFRTDGGIEARYRGEQIEFQFPPIPEPRFLVINELYHPRWKAYAGGLERPVYPTNVVMRGVLVPGGIDTVTLRFVPFIYTWPAIVSALGAVGLTGVIGVALHRRRRRSDRS